MIENVEGKYVDGPDQASTAGMPEDERTVIMEQPQEAPQPLQGLVEQLRQARLDVGALIGRLDEVERTVRRIDRQTVMMVGTLAVILYVTRQALSRVQELDA